MNPAEPCPCKTVNLLTGIRTINLPVTGKSARSQSYPILFILLTIRFTVELLSLLKLVVTKYDAGPEYAGSNIHSDVLVEKDPVNILELVVVPDGMIYFEVAELLMPYPLTVRLIIHFCDDDYVFVFNVRELFDDVVSTRLLDDDWGIR